MSDGVKMHIDGLDELARVLHAMGPDLAKNALRAGVRAGAKVIADEARATNLDDTGRTDRAIYIKHIREESTASQQTFYVGVRSGRRERKKNRDAYYWRYIEFGTAHIAAHPFMRPAFESKKLAAVEAIRARIAARIKRWEKKQ